MLPLRSHAKNNKERLGIGRLRRCQKLLLMLSSIVILFPFVCTYFGYGSRISPLYPLAGVIVAVLIQQLNSTASRISQAEDIAMKACIELLEEGFVLLRDGVESSTRSRLAWLTAARNIVISRALISEIRDETKKSIALEKELLLRLKYKSLLWPDGEGGEKLPASFYADSYKDYKSFIRSTNKKDPIAISSIVEIYRFASWPANMKDPLLPGQVFTEKEVDRMKLFGPRGLGELMREAIYPNNPDLMYHKEADDE